MASNLLKLQMAYKPSPSFFSKHSLRFNIGNGMGRSIHSSSKNSRCSSLMRDFRINTNVNSPFIKGSTKKKGKDNRIEFFTPEVGRNPIKAKGRKDGMRLSTKTPSTNISKVSKRKLNKFAGKVGNGKRRVKRTPISDEFESDLLPDAEDIEGFLMRVQQINRGTGGKLEARSPFNDSSNDSENGSSF